MSDEIKHIKIQDKGLWDLVTRDITPLKNKNIVYQGNQKSKKKTSVKKENELCLLPNTEQIQTDVEITIKTPTHKHPNKHSRETTNIDYRTQQRLKRGKIPIDGRLDLHGMTQTQAYDALLEYIPVAHASDKRCLLIITGKGLPHSGDIKLVDRCKHIGILKQKTPKWLGMPPLSSYILDIQTARSNHGGEGALYVLLRRNRR